MPLDDAPVVDDPFADIVAGIAARAKEPAPVAAPAEDDPFADIVAGAKARGGKPAEGGAAPEFKSPEEVGLPPPVAETPAQPRGPKQLRDDEDQVSRGAKPNPAYYWTDLAKTAAGFATLSPNLLKNTEFGKDVLQRNELAKFLRYTAARESVREREGEAYRKEHDVKPGEQLSMKQLHAIENRTDAAYKKMKGAQPEMSFGQTMQATWDAAVDDPGKFGSEFVKEMIANPHYMLPLFNELGLAKMPMVAARGKNAQAVVRAADAAVMGGATAVPGSAARQLEERGEVGGKTLLNDMAVAAATTAIAQPALGAAVAAIGLGAGAVKKAGRPNDGIDVRQGVTQAMDDISKGMTPEEAVQKVLEGMKVPKDKADAILQGLKDAQKEAADAEAKVARDAQTEIDDFVGPRKPPDEPGAPPPSEPPPEGRSPPVEAEKPPAVEEIEIKPPKEVVEEIEIKPPKEDIEEIDYPPGPPEEPPRPPGTTPEPPGTPPPRQPPPITVDPQPVLPPISQVPSAPVHPVERAIRSAFADQINKVPETAWTPIVGFMRQLGEADALLMERAGRKPGKGLTLGDFNKMVRDSDLPDIFKVLTHLAVDGAEHVPVKVGRMKGGYVAKYQLHQKLEQVAFNREGSAFGRGKDPWNFWADMVHEASHAKVAAIIEANPAMPAVKASRRLLDYVRSQFDKLTPAQKKTYELSPLTKDRPYGMTNIHEFYAELGSNRTFMDEMRSFELPPQLTKEINQILGVKEPGALQTVWSAATKLFGKLLGVKPENLRAYSVAYDLMNQLYQRHTPALRKQSIAAVRSQAERVRGPGAKVFAKEEDIPPQIRPLIGRAGPEDAPAPKGVTTQEAQAAVELAHGDIRNVLSANQAGAISPGMLGVLGVATAGGTALWLLTRDPWTTATAAVAAGTIAALATRGVRSVGALAGFYKDQRYRVTNLTDRFSAGVATFELDTQRMQIYLDHLVPNKGRQKVIRDWLEGDDAFRNANPLSATERAYANAIEAGFQQMQTHVKALGLDERKLLERYLTHLYVPGVNTNKSVWENLAATWGLRNETSAGMTPHSRFTMKRSIPTYIEAERLGFMPITNNPAEIFRIYANNVNQALQTKLLIDALVRERTPWGERMMVVDMSEAAMKEVMRRDAIHASQYQMSPTEKKDLQDSHAAIRAPKNFVTINHPQMRGFKVNEDIAPVMQHLFDSNDPNIITRAVHGVAVAAKRAIFSWSMFHAKSLMDALLGATAPTKLAVAGAALAGGAALATGQDSPLGYAAAGYLAPLAPSLVGKVRSARRALNDAGAAGVALREGVAGGLRVTGRPIEGDVTPFTRSLDLLATQYPLAGLPFKAVSYVTKKMDAFLWDYVHPTFKAAIFLQEYERQITKRPTVPKEQIAKEVASYTNDTFGSVDWFKIADGVQTKVLRDAALAATSPSGRRAMQILMQAPDWTVSTARSLLKAIPGVTTREIGAMHRAYAMRSALLYATIADGLNMYLSGHHVWENEDVTMLETKEGQRVQLSKHFMEPIHWLTKPGQQALNKLGYVVSEPLKLALNSDYLATRGAPPIRSPGKEVANPKLAGPANSATNFATAAREMAGHAIKGVLPITAQQALVNSPQAVISGFLGAPIYGKTEEQAVQAARERAEKAGRDPIAAERRTRNAYQKKQKEREKKHR